LIERLFLQFLTLILYVIFMGFCFCDGFKLHILRKLIWFSVFLGISLYILRWKNQFDLVLILPIPTLLAIILCIYEKRVNKAG
jgi:hypothetical protein